MVRNLLVINVGVFLVETLMRIDLGSTLGLRYIHSEYFNPIQIFTYMFLHGSGRHLFGNMLGLFFFGTFLERYLGPKKILLLYIVCGLGGGLLFGLADYIEKMPLEKQHAEYMVNPSPDAFGVFVAEFGGMFDNYDQHYKMYEQYFENPNDKDLQAASLQLVDGMYNALVNHPKSYLVGASGAVLGILMAMALLFPNTEMFLLFIPFPIKVKYLALAYAAYDIFSEMNRGQGDNVAHLAHLGGMLFAIIVVRYWQKNSSNFY
jgi:membrane associated rhomboid family serine protease